MSTAATSQPSGPSLLPPVKSRTDYKRQWKRNKKNAARTPEQRAALELAEAIKDLAPAYPSLETEINEFLYLLHQRGHQSPDRVKDGVMYALRHGAYDVEDICDETQFTEVSVLKVLAGLRALGIAEEVPRGRINPDGAQPMMWRLTGKAAATTEVLP